MRKIAWTSAGVALAIVLGSAHARAQTCDFQIQFASWLSHPHPDSIRVLFEPNVVGPASSNPAFPTQYDMLLRIRFNGVLVDEHALTLKWTQGITCPVGCPGSAVCAEKEWSFKGGLIRDRSFCQQMPTECYCAEIHAPVVQKPIRKPTGSGIIQIEIVPLNLVGCTAINPQNDRFNVPYPGSGGGSAPGLPAPGIAVLIAGMILLGAFVLRRESSGSASGRRPG
jgi:hypothetical protein